MKKHHWKLKVVIALLVLAAIGIVLHLTDYGKSLSLIKVQENALELKEYVNAHYLVSVLIFIGAYVAINVWFPGAMIMTLLGGFLYETLLGTVYVVTAAALGALTGFWISRYFIGNWIQHNWQHKLDGFNKQVSAHGAFFLVLVRMVPVMPYPLVNTLGGLTKVSAHTIAWTTALGSLPGIIIFTYAGNQLLTIRSVDDVMTPQVIIAFVLLTLFVMGVITVRFVIRKKSA